MESTQRRRWLGLLAALAAVVAAMLYRNGDELSADTRMQTPAPRVDRTLGKMDVPAAPKLPVNGEIPERLQARFVDDTVDDAFPVKSWAPPPPPPPPPPKSIPKPVFAAPLVPMLPPKPTAPPLPFKYLGRFEEQGVITFYVALGERNLLVKPGETLESQYRLESFQGNMLTFTYLPLQVQQIMPVGQPN